MLLPFKVVRRSRQLVWRRWTGLRNQLLLRLNGVRCEGPVDVVGPVHLEVLGEMTIGRGTRIASGHWANPVGGSQHTSIVVRRGGRLELGCDVGASNVEIFCWTNITIGDRTLLGGGTRIYDSDFHPLDAADRNPDRQEAIRSRPIRIGAGVFVGGGSIILKGVTIGDGAVIGAGSVVTRDVPAGEIWAGNPARFVKSLSPQASRGTGA